MLHNIRYFIRLLIAFIFRFRGIIFTGILIGLIIFIFFTFFVNKILGKEVRRIGITGRYYLENIPTNILENIGKGLTYVNKNGEVEPALADKWETPDKGKTWIFHLKKDIYWQDKTAVNSSDINYNFSDVVVEKPDNNTIIFKLKDKFSPFPIVVSQPLFKKGLLGTGEWKVKKITFSAGYIQELIMEKKGKEKNIYKFFPTEESAKIALKSGRIDILEDIYNPQPFLNWKTLKINKITNEMMVVTLFFNTLDQKLSEKTLRQALFYAIDKKAFEGPRSISPISPLSWAYNPQVKQYNFDIEKAKSLIKDLPDESKEGLKIKLVTLPILLPLAEKISINWKNIGIESTILVSSVIPQDFQVYLGILDIPKDPDQYAIWHSTQTVSNISNYKNPRIDKLLEDGRAELDLEERRKIYLDFQRFLLEDLPAAFLYHPSTYNIMRK